MGPVFPANTQRWWVLQGAWECRVFPANQLFEVSEEPQLTVILCKESEKCYLLHL